MDPASFQDFIPKRWCRAERVSGGGGVEKPKASETLSGLKQSTGVLTPAIAERTVSPRYVEDLTRSFNACSARRIGSQALVAARQQQRGSGPAEHGGCDEVGVVRCHAEPLRSYFDGTPLTLRDIAYTLTTS